MADNALEIVVGHGPDNIDGEMPHHKFMK